MSKKIITKDDLIDLGFKKHTAEGIIRQAKEIMVQQGYGFYNNRRLGSVPTAAVEQILGVSLLQNKKED